MGFRSSPYNACQSFLWGEEINGGDPRDTTSPFLYESVELNMPGTLGYLPNKPWLMKMRADGWMASDVVTYINDLQTIGATKELCQEVTRWMALVVNYLWMQDAPHKCRAPSKFPGAWTGSIVATDESGVYVLVSQECWDKTKGFYLTWKRFWNGITRSFLTNNY
jgi:hypothetical protein